MAAKTIYVTEGDRALWDALAVYAETEHRSVSYVLAQIIREFLAREVSPGV